MIAIVSATLDATLLERKEDLRMFDEFLFDPLDSSDPVAYMIYKDVMEDDDDEDDDDDDDFW